MQFVTVHNPLKHKEPDSVRRERPAKRGAARQSASTIVDAMRDAKLDDVLSYMRTPLSDPNPQFVEVRANDSMTAALAMLAEHKVHGAPVFDSEKKKHIGFIDSFDIMSAAIKIFETSGDHAYTEKDSETDEAQGRRLQEEVMISQLSARNLTGADLCCLCDCLADCSRRDPWVTFPSSASLLAVAQRLSEPSIHRVAIVNEEGKLIGLITQSALCEYLFEEHYDSIEKMPHKVKDLALPKVPLRVRDSEEALVAFQLMLEKGVSGLAVVNSVGVVVDSISHSDFSLWNEWIAGGFPLRFLSLEKLHCSVSDFLKNVRAQHRSERKHGSPITCRPDEKVVDVMGRMLENGVHRCIVIDEGGAPLSVVSYGLLLGLFTKGAEIPKKVKEVTDK